MRTFKILPAILALVAMPLGTAAEEPTTTAQVVDKIVAQERAEMNTIRRYSPLVETYIQTVRPDKALGAVPDSDKYFLGRAELDKGVQLEPLINGSGKHKFLTSIGNIFSAEFLPRGFLQMIYLDEDGFDRQHGRDRSHRHYGPGGGSSTDRRRAEAATARPQSRQSA